MAQLTHIEKVAIVGASGRIGRHFAEELVKTGKHTVTAITRADSKGDLPSGVKRVEVDYSSEDSLVAALKGQHFLVITLSVFSPPDTHSKLVQAAAKAGVPFIMPNSYGYDRNNASLAKDDLFTSRVSKQIDEIGELGVAKAIVLVCGFWYEWSLALGDPWFSIDIKERKAIFCDDGQTKINVSTWCLCGRALAALLSLPTAEMEQWSKKPLYIASFLVSQRDMLDSVHRILGTSDADWTITYEGSKERMLSGQEMMKSGDPRGFAKTGYSRMWFPNGGGDFESTNGLDNGKLGLEREELDVATKRAVDMVMSGWNPFEDVQWTDRRMENHVLADQIGKKE